MPARAATPAAGLLDSGDWGVIGRTGSRAASSDDTGRTVCASWPGFVACALCDGAPNGALEASVMSFAITGDGLVGLSMGVVSANLKLEGDMTGDEIDRVAPGES